MVDRAWRVRGLAAARRALRWWMSLGARDVTAEVAQRDALVVAPHPDDETLGTGLTILRKRAAGRRVRVVVVSDGEAAPRLDGTSDEELGRVRRAEAAEACARLGVDAADVVLLGLPDGRVLESLDELTERLRGLVQEDPPAEVYVTAPTDPHPDHAACGRAVERLRAAGVLRAEVRHVPVWQWFGWAWRDGDGAGGGGDRSGFLPPESPARVLRAFVDAPRGRRRVVVRAAPGDLARKRHALAAHASQAPTLPPGFTDDFLSEHELLVAAPPPG